MLPLIVTAASATKNTKRFLENARKLRDEAEFLFIEFTPHYPKEYNGRTWMVDFPNGRQVKIKNVAYPGNLRRWQWVKPVMTKLGYARQYGRWVIFLDTDDVIIQKGLPEVDPGKRIYVQNEGITFDQTDFWPKILKKNIAFRPIMTSQVYNAGSMMMRMEYFIDWLNFVDEKASKKSFAGAANDQPLYNLWLSKQSKAIIGDHSSLMVSLYNNMDLGRVKKDDKGVFINSNKIPFTIVHANGSTKKHL